MAKLALVTGGAGFIGHHLVASLVAAGWSVRVVDDLSRGQASRLEAIGPYSSSPGTPGEGRGGGLSNLNLKSQISDSLHPNPPPEYRERGLEFIQADVCDAAAMQKAVRGVDVIFHQAAWAGVPQSVNQPLEYHHNNATGTLTLLEAAREAGVRRFIYAASSSAYGDQPELPKHEGMTPTPISPYAAAKYAGELYVSLYAKLHGMETIRLRYFNVFGPGQDPQSQYGAAIPAVVLSLLRGKPPTIYGDGEQTRDFCFVENVVRANMLAAEAPKLNGEAINIACGRRVSVNRIVKLANDMLGSNITPTYHPPRLGDVRDSWAKIELAEKLIGYRPTVFFEEGLRRSIDWYRQLVTRRGTGGEREGAENAKGHEE